MPELPEVETVRRGLELTLAPPGSRITTVELRRRDLRAPFPHDFRARLEGRTISGYRRWGKYLLWDTREVILLSHLGMSGTWREAARGAEREHDHVYLYLADGRRLAYRDPRRFGHLALIEPGRERDHPCLRDLGPDAIDHRAFNVAYLHAALRGRNAPIKSLILDQRIVAGVGNIYASEALYRAAIHPTRAAGRIARPRLERLVDAIRAVLAEAIESGGSTLRDYRGTGGELGMFQHRFLVYGRDGLPCMACQHPLRGGVVGGRSTVWCGSCQR